MHEEVSCYLEEKSYNDAPVLLKLLVNHENKTNKTYITGYINQVFNTKYKINGSIEIMNYNNTLFLDIVHNITDSIQQFEKKEFYIHADEILGNQVKINSVSNGSKIEIGICRFVRHDPFLNETEYILKNIVIAEENDSLYSIKNIIRFVCVSIVLIIALLTVKCLGVYYGRMKKKLYSNKNYTGKLFNNQIEENAINPINFTIFEEDEEENKNEKEYKSFI